MNENQLNINNIKEKFNAIREQRSFKRLDITHRYNKELIEFDSESIKLLEVIKPRGSMRKSQFTKTRSGMRCDIVKESD